MTLTPYVFFNGRCDEALAFYSKALGAKVEMRMTFAESPDKAEFPLPPGWGAKVMHSSARIGDSLLFASDGMSPEMQPMGSFSLSLNLPDVEAARRAFEALAEGGKVMLRFGPTFWSPGYGILIDAFGVGWMVGTDA